MVHGAQIGDPILRVRSGIFVRRLARADVRGVPAVESRVGGKRSWLRVAGGRTLVLDPLENLFPMDLDVPRRFDSNTNVGAIHTKDRHNDVRTDPDCFARSPREYQHISLLACLEMAIIAARSRPYSVSLSRQGVEVPDVRVEAFAPQRPAHLSGALSPTGSHGGSVLINV
jgi:hypothetical protein